jgi:hypothetical protein
MPHPSTDMQLWISCFSDARQDDKSKRLIRGFSKGVLAESDEWRLSREDKVYFPTFALAINNHYHYCPRNFTEGFAQLKFYMKFSSGFAEDFNALFSTISTHLYFVFCNKPGFCFTTTYGYADRC